MTPVIFRIVVSVSHIDAAAIFYGMLLDTPGRRISAGRHEFAAGPVTLSCYDAESEGDETPHVASPEPICFSVENVDETYERYDRMGLLNGYAEVKIDASGERLFYMQDPFGNPLCIVHATSRIAARFSQESRNTGE